LIVCINKSVAWVFSCLMENPSSWGLAMSSNAARTHHGCCWHWCITGWIFSWNDGQKRWDNYCSCHVILDNHHVEIIIKGSEILHDWDGVEISNLHKLTQANLYYTKWYKCINTEWVCIKILNQILT
jgi:hypothetical protein